MDKGGWVHDNAELMGGDPSKITIFGESAGAVSVGYHLLSPRSMHLINNAIMMSGSPTVSWGVQDRVLAMDRSKKLARSVSCPTSSHAGMMDCLRSADPLELVTKQWDLISSFFDVPIGPVVDGTFLTDHPAELLARRQIKNTSVIAGVVHDEGTFWLLYGFSKVFGRQDPNPINASQFESVVEGVLKPFGAAYQDELVKKLTTIQYYDSVPPSERTPNMYLDVLDDIR
ncbi:cholinesterase-like [Aplysia californica]|uniref:Cholinesterase-like n=1 Tax=Aplysia californica TaxID=6500 RepID=A0ABM1W4Q8_APLCA|nr:cholinesterase-like [Aplysia californica]